MAPSRHDWKIVDWDVKPQHNQPNIGVLDAKSLRFLLDCVSALERHGIQLSIHLYYMVIACVWVLSTKAGNVVRLKGYNTTLALHGSLSPVKVNASYRYRLQWPCYWFFSCFYHSATWWPCSQKYFSRLQWKRVSDFDNFTNPIPWQNLHSFDINIYYLLK